jgi:hypothetical protein
MIAARTLSVFFLFWSIFNLTEIPQYVVAFLYYRTTVGTTATESFYAFWSKREVGYIASALLRSVVEFWLAGVFYRCGPKIANFLIGDEVVATTDESLQS